MIHINEDWAIGSDGTHNIQLLRKTIARGENKGGNWAIEGNYQCYEHVLNALVEKRLLLPDGIEALVAEIGKLREEIRTALVAIENSFAGAIIRTDMFRLTGARKIDV